MSKWYNVFCKILVSTLLTGANNCLAEGPSGTGGGDEYTLDFVQTATQEVYPLLIKHGKKLVPQVNPSDFWIALNPTKIKSEKHVYETCNETTEGREVAACYNGQTDQIILSRTLYPKDVTDSAAKIGLVAHEVFRKMKIEGDGYEVTRQLPIKPTTSIQVDDVAAKECKVEGSKAKTTRTLKQGETVMLELCVPREANEELGDFIHKFMKTVKKKPTTVFTITDANGLAVKFHWPAEIPMMQSNQDRCFKCVTFPLTQK